MTVYRGWRVACLRHLVGEVRQLEVYFPSEGSVRTRRAVRAKPIYAAALKLNVSVKLTLILLTREAVRYLTVFWVLARTRQ